MKILSTAILISLLVTSPFFASAQQVMSSATYKIESDSLNNAGVLSTSASYGLEDTAGEVASGRSTSASFGTFNLGYQGMRTDISAPTVIPPTTPTGVTATAKSQSSIEITWDESTGDLGVTRYNIYRDGSRIANVVDFPRDYVDTGLSAGTTYTYKVSAVDSEGNESALSNEASATTTGSPSSSGAASQQTVFSNLNVLPSDTSVIVTFVTRAPYLAEFGGSSESVPTTQHRLVVNGLTPDTRYVEILTLVDTLGNKLSFGNISFTTLSAPFVLVTPNISNLRIAAATTSLNLTWTNPSDPQMVGVRVVRSTQFYPSSPEDGTLLAQGDLSSYRDDNVVPGTTYYYAVFAQDLTGNFSSGVVGSGEIPRPGEQPTNVPPITILPNAAHVDPQIDLLKFADFLFVQSGDSLPVKNDEVSIDGSKNTTIALTYFHLPEVLKTIAVTLTTLGDNPQTFTFILRVNSNKTRFEATLAPLGVTRDYAVRVTVVDFKNEGQKKLDGLLHVTNGPTMLNPLPGQKPIGYWFLLLILAGVLALFLIVKNRKK